MIDYNKLIPILDDSIWEQLKYFNPRENWGNYKFVDVRLLWGLDRLREELARGIVINCGYESKGHVNKSFHKIGMAVDFYVQETKPEELYHLYCFFLDNWFGGCGVYPYWKPCAGLHLDLGPDRTWVRDKEGVYHSDSNKIRDVIVCA